MERRGSTVPAEETGDSDEEGGNHDKRNQAGQKRTRSRREGRNKSRVEGRGERGKRREISEVKQTIDRGSSMERIAKPCQTQGVGRKEVGREWGGTKVIQKAGNQGRWHGDEELSEEGEGNGKGLGEVDGRKGVTVTGQHEVGDVEGKSRPVRRRRVVGSRLSNFEGGREDNRGNRVSRNGEIQREGEKFKVPGQPKQRRVQQRDFEKEGWKESM
ncbi:hypothetical protein B0H10DRAFT_2299881 [Mycena sp. CBHHK59/15]|nr:hypothetical protein B0H10DRAFT_2299881 [Mycena sp. CBHHK59/15]